MTLRRRRPLLPFSRFARSQKGMAAVEFALVVPVMLIAYLGATDLTQALAIDRKLGQVASTVSDLVARETQIRPEQIHGYFNAGRAIMRPFEFEGTRLELTIVKVEGNAPRVVGATSHHGDSWTIKAANGNDLELPDEMMALANGKYLVKASASYAFTPLFTTVFNGTVNLEQSAVHIVRDHDDDEFIFGAITPPAPVPPEPDPEPEPEPEPEPAPTPTPPGSGGGSQTCRWFWFVVPCR